MERYGQFCPVALAADLVTRRWTPLLLRELLYGSHRFNDLHRGLPRISRTLLSQRLSELEEAGVVERRFSGGHPEYHLTEAGNELWPVIAELGIWGKRWAGAPSSGDLDPGFLLWDMQRGALREHLPASPVLVRFRFVEGGSAPRSYWLWLRREGVEMHADDPGGDVGVEVETDVRTLTAIWMGDLELGDAMRRDALRLRGAPELREPFPEWLGSNLFAGYRRAR
jgi:DNA-binding HxlR family transcriptional regulator